MASFGHVAVGLAAGRSYAMRRSGARAPTTRELARAMIGFAVASLAPDLDAIAFVLRIPYGAPFGHRGATHSLAFAVACGAVCLVDDRRRRLRALYATLVVASHGLLDAMTDGGRGVALLWPYTTRRYFLPWRPIPVAPIGRGLFTAEGLHVIGFELVAFLPFVLYALWPRRRG